MGGKGGGFSGGGIGGKGGKGGGGKGWGLGGWAGSWAGGAPQRGPVEAGQPSPLPVPNLSKEEASELARLCGRAGDKVGATKYSSFAKSLAATEERAKQPVSAHQAAQQHRALVRRLEKQLEGDLARLLRLQSEVQEQNEKVKRVRCELQEADRVYNEAVQKLAADSKVVPNVEKAKLRFEDLLSGSVDIGSIISCDILEDFGHDDELELSTEDREEMQKRTALLSQGIADMAKSVFQQAVDQAKRIRLVLLASVAGVKKDFMKLVGVSAVLRPLQQLLRVEKLIPPRRLGAASRCQSRRRQQTFVRVQMLLFMPVSQLEIATVNGNSWGTFYKFLESTSARVVIGQEHRLRASDIDQKSEICKNAGFKTVWAPGVLGE
ncbi:unnamed protein product, partial [Prorocentrum cordatum]